jgi:CubicO group peptidase (beta-lactamase class C family)
MPKKMKALFVLAGAALALNSVAQPVSTARLDSLTSVYEKAGFHGVILVARGDSVLYRDAYGLANFEKKIPHTITTEFKTESVGKMFTAVSILQQVESGRLRLDQTVKELLPELKIPNADKITMHHLLTHTSGMQSPWDHPQWSFKKVYSRPELETIIAEVPPVFDTPGKEMYYSNSGYTVLGWILEKVSGKPFDQYFQEHLFNPLKMTATRHLMDTVMPEKTGAQPYRILNSKKYITMSETLGPKAGAAGGWISTAGDLHRFMAALYGGRLIQPQTWKLMQAANGNAPKQETYRYYAYGLETFANMWLPGATVYGHNGGGAGFSVDAYVEPVSGTIVVSCTNLYQNSRPIAANFFKAVLDKPLMPVSRPPAIALYDKIVEGGIDAFIAGEKEAFKSMGVQPNPGLFAQVSEAMEAADDKDSRVKWMALARNYYPEEGFIYMLSGDSFRGAGNKPEARKMYESARTLAQKKGDQRLLQAAEGKLKEL